MKEVTSKKRKWTEKEEQYKQNKKTKSREEYNNFVLFVQQNRKAMIERIKAKSW